MNSAITVYNQHISEVINTDFHIEVLASDSLFTEGPVWHKSGYYLFSDTLREKQWRGWVQVLSKDL